MATWIEINLNLEQLDKSRISKTDNGTYYRALVKVVDEYRYGKNAYVITSYDKENKPEKEHKIGNGRVVFTSGTIEKAVNDEQPTQAKASTVVEDADLPF